MPKVVDHATRRRDIVLATLRVVARGGLQSATMREIAKESGYSTGVLAHYFDDKEQLVAQAHRAAYEIVNERIMRSVVSFVTLTDLRTAIFEVLPLDERRYMEAQIDVAFWDQALHEDGFRRDRWQYHLDAQLGWSNCFAQLRAHGAIATAVSDEHLAVELVVIIDGLVVQRLLYPEQIGPEMIVAIIDRFLDRIAA